MQTFRHKIVYYFAIFEILEANFISKIGKMLIIAGISLMPVFLPSCANQIPPSGGEEDKVPPKVKVISPVKNSINFTGKTIDIEFDKYVDKRSFQDAFRISPQIKGDVNYKWSGTEVEIEFEKPFFEIDPTKTFVVTINTTLQDIHGNALTQPVSFAFSTGPKIDMASITGKVFDNNSKNIAIFAYNLDKGTYDPTKNLADYFTETSLTGEFNMTNMGLGKYRLIAVQDDDKNYLYTAGRENYAVLPFDLSIADSQSVKGINFRLKDISGDTVKDELNYDKYYKDTVNIIFTSIKDDSRNILPEQSIFIFFNKHKPTRDEFVSSLKMKDEVGNTEKLVFDWHNDSLVEVFPSNRFILNMGYMLSFSLKVSEDSTYNFELKFHTITNNSYGDMKGSVVYSSVDTNEIDTVFQPLKVLLSTTILNPQVKYVFEVKDTNFAFTKILDAEYSLFAFIDSKGTGLFDYGSAYPFENSEPFYFYPQSISIKGGWTVENVIINIKR